MGIRNCCAQQLHRLKSAHAIPCGSSPQLGDVRPGFSWAARRLLRVGDSNNCLDASASARVERRTRIL